MKDVQSIEAVWNQNKGMVLLLIEAKGLSLQLEMSRDNANDLADVLRNAADVPDRARRQAGNDKVETVADIIRREAQQSNEAIYLGGPMGGSMHDAEPTKYHPDQAGNGVAAESYQQ